MYYKILYMCVYVYKFKKRCFLCFLGVYSYFVDLEKFKEFLFCVKCK